MIVSWAVMRTWPPDLRTLPSRSRRHVQLCRDTREVLVLPLEV